MDGDGYQIDRLYQPGVQGYGLTSSPPVTTAMKSTAPAPVIVGAGPAGLACAAALLQAGLRPIVLEEASRPGGQGSRRLAAPMAGHATQLLGKRQTRSTAQREALEDRILAACDWRPDSLVWGHDDHRLMVLQHGHHDSIAYEQLLIASGAIDRILAFPGWTLPGVFTLGAAQVALKHHAALIGQRVVLAGASPLLYLVAAQYLRLGARDLVIVDTTPASQQRRAVPGMAWHSPATLVSGLRWMHEIRRAGIRRINGTTLARAVGQTRLQAIDIRHTSGQIETLACDALAFGYGLRPETQLAELAGAQFYFDTHWRDWFAVIDPDGRAGPRLWLAGDGAMIGGREAAALSGRLAALAMLASRPGATHGIHHEIVVLRRRVARLRRYQRAMALAFAWPHESAGMLPETTIVCRCERVTAAVIRRALSQPAAPLDVNRVKAITRCGMGRCQGRYCAPTLQELVAATRACPIQSVGRLRAQAPVRPIAIGSAGPAYTGETVTDAPQL